MRTAWASSLRRLGASLLAVMLCAVLVQPAQAITSNSHFTPAIPVTEKTAYTGVLVVVVEPCTGLFVADNPVNLDDPSGHDYGDFSIKLSTIFLPFLETPMLADSIINATGASALNPTGLPVKTIGDKEVDGQLNWVYSKIRAWEKELGHGSVAKEPWDLFASMMRGPTVDTIYRGSAEKNYLYQYTGAKYPRLLNRTFINSDINYLGFGEGYSARGILGMHAVIREHLWVDYNSGPLGLPIWIGKRPSANTFAAADTGYDWGANMFWPSSGKRHGSGN